MRTLFLFLLLLFPLTTQAEELQVHVSGITLHGLRNTGVAPRAMPRRIDNNGQLVFTPGVALLYKDKQNYLYNISLLKDCYDHWAGTLLFGKEFETGVTGLSWSLLGGLYARQEAWLCVDGTCVRGVDMPLRVSTGGMDLMPMAFAGLHYKIPVRETEFFHINILSNFFLTQMSVGYGWSF
ncbi:MAG: hypothetical protein KF802_02505 [Bdellovibrionaceae bacterium]|nr:hypothetical protein [Pseudobdellovibrionaceae bacterium]